LGTYVPVADTIQVAVQAEISGVPMEFVLHFKWPSAITVTLMNGVGTTFVDWIINTLAPLIYAGVTFNSVKLTDLTTVSSPSFDWFAGTTLSLPKPGTGSGVGAPQQASIMASLRTANRGRSYRGRTYFYGMLASQVNNTASWNPTAIGAFLSAFATVIGDMVSAGWTPVIVSKVQNGVTLSAGVTTPIQTISVDTGIKTQRRRLL